MCADPNVSNNNTMDWTPNKEAAKRHSDDECHQPPKQRRRSQDSGLPVTPESNPKPSFDEQYSCSPPSPQIKERVLNGLQREGIVHGDTAGCAQYGVMSSLLCAKLENERARSLSEDVANQVLA